MKRRLLTILLFLLACPNMDAAGQMPRYDPKKHPQCALENLGDDETGPELAWAWTTALADGKPEARDDLRRTPLMIAAAFDDAILVRAILRAGADVNAVDAVGHTALMYAAAYGGADAITELLLAGPNLQTTTHTPECETALHIAAGYPQGRPECVRLLIEAGCNINARDMVGRPPLTHAAEQGDVQRVRILLAHNRDDGDAAAAQNRLDDALVGAALIEKTAMISVLLDAGADVHYADGFWGTPLHAAAEGDDRPTIELLVAAGADLESPRHCAGGRTPLMVAAMDGSAKAVQALLDAGAELDRRDRQGRTALTLAATALIHTHHGDYQPADDVCERIRILAAAGADLEARDNLGRTPLVACAAHHNGTREQARCLLRVGADVNAADRDGVTVLMHAASQRLPSFVDVLLDAGADVSARDNEEQTALMHAVDRTQSSIWQLVRAGANLEARDARGWTALRHAVEVNRRQSVAILVNIGADASSLQWSPLHRAIWTRPTRVIGELLEDEPDLEARDVFGQTPLMAASRLIWLDGKAIPMLIQAGAQIEARDDLGRTALMLAARYTVSDEVKALLALGADPNAVDHEGRTAVMHAAMSKYGRFSIRNLTNAGADINARDKAGRTALMHAIMGESHYKLHEIVDTLLECGADPAIPDHEGRTPLDVIRTGDDQKDTVKLIERLETFIKPPPAPVSPE